ncbi:MAG: sensor histidine kinase [Nevskiales bacterium]
MRLQPNLNLSVALAMILLVALASSLLALVIGYASEQLQRELLDKMALDEAEELLGVVTRDPAAPLPRSPHDDVWLEAHPDSDPLPAVFQQLSMGTHHDIVHSDRIYHVLRGEIGGKAAVVAINLSKHNVREFRMRLMLGLSALLAPAAVLGAALFLSRRITGPVVELSARLNKLQATERRVRLSSDFRGREVEQIAQAFDRYQERLDQFVEREQAFSAAASHELRTPLATVTAATELLEHERDLPERLHGVVRRMLRATRQMGDLLTGLMWLAREHETHPVAELSLKEELHGIIQEYQSFAELKGVRLESAVNTERRLMLPLGHVAIVVGNLLRNAVQNTPAGGLVRLEVQDDLVTVEDTGRGIEPRHLHRIFDRDFRGADSPGAGLGLFISQRICLHHGWPLTLDSTLGQGTVVSLRLLPAAAQ